MRGNFIFIISLLACTAFLSFCAFAGEFVDGMDDLSGNNIRSYSGLRRVATTTAAFLPDKTAFTLAGPPQGGQALYRVQGASQVRVSIVTQHGTFVAQMPGLQGDYALGAYQENMGNVLGAPQALYSPSTGGVYTQVGGAWLQAIYDRYAVVFAAVSKAPSDLRGYGVNIGYSVNGATYTDCRLVRQNAQIDIANNICSEDFLATVSTSAKYIAVNINDYYSLSTTDGQLLQNPNRLFVTLCEVAISGDHLIMGEPEPVESVPASSAAEATESADSSQSASSQRPVSSKSEPPPAPSKFEGVISSSTKGSSATSSSQSQSKSSKSSRSSSSSSAAEAEEKVSYAEPEPGLQAPEIVYEVAAREDATDRFTGGIIAYMAVLSVIIGTLVVLGRKR